MGRSSMVSVTLVFVCAMFTVMSQKTRETCVGHACAKPGRSVLQISKQTFGVPQVSEVEEDEEVAEETDVQKASTLNVKFFDAPLTVSTGSKWGTAMSELMEFCQEKGYRAGVPTGHVGSGGKKVRGVYCLSGDGVKHSDAQDQTFAVETDWGNAFRSIHSWCTSQGLQAGVPNGHHSGDLRGCYCFKRGPFIRKYNVDITVTRGPPLIGKFKYYNDNDWGKAMRTIGKFCRDKGWQWGFTNGYRGPYIKYDYVEAYCFKEA